MGDSKVATKTDLAVNLSIITQSLVTSLAQIRIHRAMARQWGYSKLDTQLESVIGDLSSDLDCILVGILASEGTPDLQGLNRLNIGQTVEEIFQSESRMARELLERTCDALLQLPPIDLQVANPLQQLTRHLSGHVNFFEQGLELIRQMGTPNFLATRC